MGTRFSGSTGTGKSGRCFPVEKLRFFPIQPGIFRAVPVERLRFSAYGYPRFNREFYERFRLKSSVFFDSGFSRFNREVPDAYSATVEPENRVPIPEKDQFFSKNRI